MPEELTYVISLLEKELGKVAVREMLPMQPGDVEATYADVEDPREGRRLPTRDTHRGGCRALRQMVPGLLPDLATELDRSFSNLGNRMKIFVTGGAGQVGSTVIDMFLSRGDERGRDRQLYDRSGRQSDQT